MIMSDLLKNMFRRVAVKYGHPRPRSRARSRSSTTRSAESPVLDLSNQGHPLNSGNLKRRTLDMNMSGSEKQRDLVLPPAPAKSVGIYGGRRAVEDPYAAPDCLPTDNSFDFYVKRSGIQLKDSDLQKLFLMFFGIFLTSLMVAFAIGYVTLSTQPESTASLTSLTLDHISDRSSQSTGQCGPERNSKCRMCSHVLEHDAVVQR